MTIPKIARNLAVLLTSFCFAYPALARVTVDFDKTVNFSKYKTYAWLKGTPAPNELAQKRIQQAIEQKLTAKGLTKADGPPDLYVVTHASSRKEQYINIDDFGYGGFHGRRGGRSGPGTITVNVYDIPIGTLVVDILDGGSKELVWHAIAEETLSDNPQKNAKRIDKVVKKMFKKFPPKR